MTPDSLSKIWKKCDRQRFLPRSTKKSVELLSTKAQTKKFYWLTLSDFSVETTISPLGGAAPSNLYTIRARDWPSLDSTHTQMGMGSPQKNFWPWKFKVWTKIQRISLYNFGASGSILTTRRRDELWSKITSYSAKCSYSGSWRKSLHIRHVVLRYSFRSHSPDDISAREISTT